MHYYFKCNNWLINGSALLSSVTHTLVFPGLEYVRVEAVWLVNKDRGKEDLRVSARAQETAAR